MFSAASWHETNASAHRSSAARDAAGCSPQVISRNLQCALVGSGDESAGLPLHQQKRKGPLPSSQLLPPPCISLADEERSAETPPDSPPPVPNETKPGRLQQRLRPCPSHRHDWLRDAADGDMDTQEGVQRIRLPFSRARPLRHSSVSFLPISQIGSSHDGGSLAVSPRDTLLDSSRLRRSMSMCNPTASPRLPQVCPACLMAVKPSMLETLGCGVHLCCSDCAATSARLQVRSGRLPQCFHPGCRATVEPWVAQRLLQPDDYELYAQLALWSNPCVESCPLCSALIYVDPAPTRTSSSLCPSCHHYFCADCRCAIHPDITCEAALKKQEGNICTASLPLEITDQQNLKKCPRCSFLIEKCDVDSCDHMTCTRCSHEFCWACLADRRVISAHGNHHHRTFCKFYAPFAGTDEHLPEKCWKCASRGSACRHSKYSSAAARRSHGDGCVSQRYAAFVDVCKHMLRLGGA